MRVKSMQCARPLKLSLLLIFATTGAGLAIRFAPFGLPPVVVKFGGSMLWALMLYWIASTVLRSFRLLTVALFTATLTTAIEFFKLYHSPTVDAFRPTLPGILLLGRFFSFRDILAYWIAISIGVLIDRQLCSDSDEKN